MSNSGIRENLAHIRDRIAQAAVAADRDPATVRLLAVSKRIEHERIAAAYDAGQRAFGENVVQELQRKTALFPDDCEWHLIGHLQRNKVRPAVVHAAWIHSIDSVELLERVNRIAGEEQRRPILLLEINVSGEASKFGASRETARNLLGAALRCPHVRCAGLMTMAPFDAGKDELAAVFGGLRDLRDTLAAEFATDLPELSMGMSADFETAIHYGATIVRVGTSVFGARQY